MLMQPLCFSFCSSFSNNSNQHRATCLWWCCRCIYVGSKETYHEEVAFTTGEYMWCGVWVGVGV